MAFEFRLDKLLEIREKAVTELEAQLREVKSKKQRVEDWLSCEKEEYFKEREMINCSFQQHNLDKLSLLDASLEQRKAKMMNLLKAIREIKEEENKMESLLVAAKIDLKSIEKLKEKRKQEYDKEQKMKEQKEMDEISNRLFYKESLYGPAR